MIYRPPALSGVVFIEPVMAFLSAARLSALGMECVDFTVYFHEFVMSLIVLLGCRAGHVRWGLYFFRQKSTPHLFKKSLKKYQAGMAHARSMDSESFWPMPDAFYKHSTTFYYIRCFWPMPEAICKSTNEIRVKKCVKGPGTNRYVWWQPLRVTGSDSAVGVQWVTMS